VWFPWALDPEAKVRIAVNSSPKFHAKDYRQHIVMHRVLRVMQAVRFATARRFAFLWSISEITDDVKVCSCASALQAIIASVAWPWPHASIHQDHSSRTG
jgi:hypothetical protein